VRWVESRDKDDFYIWVNLDALHVWTSAI